MATLLLVDNSQFIIERLKNIVLEKHKVIGVAKDAEEAVEQYKTLKPDLVTMDLVMPKVNGKAGLEAIRDIRAADPQARILVVTAMGQQTIIEEALAAGASGHIIKPLEDAHTLDMIDQCLAVNQAV